MGYQVQYLHAMQEKKVRVSYGRLIARPQLALSGKGNLFKHGGRCHQGASSGRWTVWLMASCQAMAAGTLRHVEVKSRDV
jgi:hypothetical protein